MRRKIVYFAYILHIAQEKKADAGAEKRLRDEIQHSYRTVSDEKTAVE